MIGQILAGFNNGLRILLGVLMATLAVPVAMQVISRYTGLIPTFLWTEELATFIFVWIVMIGSIVAVWDGSHFDVRVTPDAKNPAMRLLQTSVVHLAILLFGLMFAIYGIEYAEFGNKQKSVMMRMNLVVTHISLTIAGTAWAIISAWRLIEAGEEFLAASKGAKP